MSLASASSRTDHGLMSNGTEKDIMSTIRELVDEEHALRSTSDGLEPEERRRMKELEESLDQCWDLLRGRRARSEYGQDPDETGDRSVTEVENYWQYSSIRKSWEPLECPPQVDTGIG